MAIEKRKQTLYVLVALLVLGGIAVGLRFFVPDSTQIAAVEENLSAAVSDVITLPEAEPVRLRISKIGVDVSFVELGVTENQEIEIPTGYEEVGWYKHGPTPGELGPAVVLGHVDSKDGPAVFFSLGQLNPGDRVEIDRDDGTTAEFEVKTLERYEQKNFPTSLVYGDIDHAGLRLITCSGSYDRESKRYDHNLVVYAELVEE